MMVLLEMAEGGARVTTVVEEVARYITEAVAALLRSNKIDAFPRNDKALAITYMAPPYSLTYCKRKVAAPYMVNMVPPVTKIAPPRPLRCSKVVRNVNGSIRVISLGVQY